METIRKMGETLRPSQGTGSRQPAGFPLRLSNIVRILCQLLSKLCGFLGETGILVGQRVSRLPEACALATNSTVQFLKDVLKKTWKLLENMPIGWAAVICIFAFVVALGLEANDPSWPLARMSTTYGILLLSILSKFSDYGFKYLTDMAWEKLALVKKSPKFPKEDFSTWIKDLLSYKKRQGNQLWWSSRLWSFLR